MNKPALRIGTVVLIVLLTVSMGWVIIQNVRFFNKQNISYSTAVMLDGEYSIDGGAWQPIDHSKPVTARFHKAVFKGRYIQEIAFYKDMFVSAKNVWFSLRLAEEEIPFMTNKRLDPSTYLQKDKYGPQDHLTDTPGYTLTQNIPADDPFLQRDENGFITNDMILEVEYPYGFAAEGFSDCFQVTLTSEEGLYQLFFYNVLPSELLFLLICFFGIFFFPIASGLLGRIDFRYVTFGALCFFAGVFLIMQQASGFLNLWISDATVCMMTDKVTDDLFLTAVLLYFSSLTERRALKTIAVINAFVFFAASTAALILHVNAVADMVTTTPALRLAGCFCTVVITVLLCAELPHKRRSAVLPYLVAWLPLVITILLDTADFFWDFTGLSFVLIGLAVTILYQLIRFAVDFRRQYLEAIRYQQVQKELYEAKVAVMTSQIRPHFMYNALTSIAMMCTIDPKTAQEATVTFAKYLRGNMDSLKQTAPVPFAQELEHLKKYLYIEKLRFDDLLQIEYDIQTTDFVLPQLSIQPLVENAVKHGVGMKEDGGTVKISTRETDDAYEIIIEDDGVGFDVNEQQNDGRSHVGMENTKKRLREMCSGEVKIESKIGEGTTARVILPKEGQHRENTVS